MGIGLGIHTGKKRKDPRPKKKNREIRRNNMTTVQKYEENKAFVLWFYAFPQFYSVGENWHKDMLKNLSGKINKKTKTKQQQLTVR